MPLFRRFWRKKPAQRVKPIAPASTKRQPYLRGSQNTRGRHPLTPAEIRKRRNRRIIAGTAIGGGVLAALLGFFGLREKRMVVEPVRPPIVVPVEQGNGRRVVIPPAAKSVRVGERMVVRGETETAEEFRRRIEEERRRQLEVLNPPALAEFKQIEKEHPFLTGEMALEGIKLSLEDIGLDFEGKYDISKPSWSPQSPTDEGYKQFFKKGNVFALQITLPDGKKRTTYIVCEKGIDLPDGTTDGFFRYRYPEEYKNGHPGLNDGLGGDVTLIYLEAYSKFNARISAVYSRRE